MTDGGKSMVRDGLRRRSLGLQRSCGECAGQSGGEEKAPSHDLASGGC